MATGGKPYYVAGLYPVLLAAGGEPVAAWTRRSVGRARVFVAALALALINNALIVLPVLPVTAIAVSNVAQPGPRRDRRLAAVRRDRGRGAGEPARRAGRGAGPQLRRGRRRRPLPARAAARAQRPQRVLGPRAAARRRDRRHRRRVPGRAAAGLVRAGRAGRASSTTASALDNDEQGVPVWVARDPRAPWPELWPQLRRLGYRRRAPRPRAGPQRRTGVSGARRRPSPRGPGRRRCRWPSGRARRTRGRAPGRPGRG